MSRAVVGSDLTVVFGTLILIAYQHGNRRSGCLSFKNTGEDLNLIIFLSGCGDLRLTGLPPVKKNLDIMLGK